MRFLPALAAVGIAVLPYAPARAEEPPACPAKSAILALSENVLAGRETLPRLKARGFGAEAAYLKIRYGALSVDAATTLAHGLREAGVREAIDLAGALDALGGGFDAVPKDTASAAQLGVLISTLKAVLDYGDAEKLLAAIAALPAEQQVTVSQRIVPAVVDWPDDRKIALAAIAARHGLSLLQAGLAATQQDPKAWARFTAAFPQPDKLPDLTRTWSWAPALMGNPMLPRLPADDAATDALRKSSNTVVIAAAREPERDFLMTYLNYTWDTAETAKAAQAVIAEVDAGRLRPEGLFDTAWLTAYRALRTATGDPARVEKTLADIQVHSRRYLRTADPLSVRDVIDRLIAVEALTPYLKDEAAALPAMPADLSARFQADWPLWTEVAGALKATPLAPLARDPLKALVVAELLFAAGDHARLGDFILAVEPAEPRLSLATDFAMRLDRTCASYMHHPAEALMLSGQPIFRFDPVK